VESVVSGGAAGGVAPSVETANAAMSSNPTVDTADLKARKTRDSDMESSFRRGVGPPAASKKQKFI
jgi:hypothetical protein